MHVPGEGKLALAALSTFLMVLSILLFVLAGAAIAQHKPIFFRYPLLVRGGTSMDSWQAVVVGILCLAFGRGGDAMGFQKTQKMNARLFQTCRRFSSHFRPERNQPNSYAYSSYGTRERE